MAKAKDPKKVKSGQEGGKKSGEARRAAQEVTVGIAGLSLDGAIKHPAVTSLQAQAEASAGEGSQAKAREWTYIQLVRSIHVRLTHSTLNTSLHLT